MAYTETQWVTGDPITQERMRKIERGIADAHTAVSLIDNNITVIENNATELSDRVLNVEELTRNTAQLAQQAKQDAQQGIWAWPYVKNTMQWINDTTPVESLATILENMKSNIQDNGTIAQTTQQWIINAYNTGGNIYDEVMEVERSAQSLSERIGEIYRRIKLADISIKDISNIITPVDGSRTLVHRINAIDGNQVPSRTLISIIEEINNAHASSQNSADYDGIDDRFEADETVLNNHTVKISALEDTRIKYEDIVNDLTSIDINKPLSANKGKELKDTIGGNYSPSNTVASGIQNAQSSAEANAKNYVDLNKVDKDDIYNGTDYTLDDDKVLDARVGKTLADSIASLSQSTNTTTTSLNNRIDSLNTDIHTIAEELAMVDTDTIVNSNTRIDTIEDTINDNTTGLAATKTVADSALAAANNNASSISTLSTQITNLSNRDTVILTDITFANGRPIISNPSTECDYLLKGTNDDKYYYWRYFGAEEGWQLISGAGGGGGSSSGEIVSELPSANEASETTDYFVGNNETGYLHYRFTTINGVKQAILIGADPNNIKNYNIEKITRGDSTYLRLYEFNYGNGNIIDVENTIPDWTASTSYNVEDLVLYQGYFYRCTTANADEEWNSSRWELISDTRAVTTIELPQGGGGMISGAVTRFIRLAPTNITTIQSNEPIYIHFFYSCVDPSAGSFDGRYSLKDQNGAELLTGTINSGDGTGSVTSWPQDKEEGYIYNDGYASINVGPYCTLGKNTFNITITTTTNETFTRSWTVDIKQLSIVSDASESVTTEIGNTIDLPYIPYGAMNKILIVKIDGTQVKTESLGAGITGTQQVCTIPAQSVAGAHSIELRLSAQISGETKYSDPVVRDYIWYDPSATDTIIISSPYRNKTIETSQYDEIVIPYTVYKANTNSFTAEYYYDYDENGENTPFDTVTLNNSNSGTIRYIPVEASVMDTGTNSYIPHHITLKIEQTTITFDFIATPMQKDIAPVPGEVIDFNPATFNNNSTNHGLPSYLSVSDNFNWSTNWEGENQDSGGGYRTDEDGKCFVIKAGTYAEVDYQMFKQHNVDAGDGTTITTSNVFDTGAEMKLIFKVTNVRDASTVWFTNMGNFVNTQDENAKKVGIQLKAHEGWLKTDKASDTADTDIELPAGYVAWSKTKAYSIGDVVVYKAIIYQCIKAIAAPAEGEENSWNKKAWQSLGQLETEISATNSYLYFPYSEDDKIELDININKHGNNQNFIMSYEDGVPSKAYPYDYSTGGDILYHVLNNESKIHIGSPDCDVHIYRLRIYNKSLTTNEILKNFIADGETINERIARYDRNSIYYNPELNDGDGGYTPYKTGAATLDPYRLAERIPDVKVLMLEAPRFTTGKKDFVKGTTLRCIQAAGGKVYPANLDKDNWYFFNGYHAGQGTTSDNYGQSARNVDFLFECDGSHAPTKTGNLSANEWIDYQSELAQGENASVYNQTEKSWSVAPGVTTSKCQDWMGDDCKVSLTHFNMNTKQVTNEATSIPNNYFNLKVNVASSENVNNALFQKRYNDFLPYTSPAKNRDSRIKNDMEFVPAVLFIREKDADLSTHKEFNDTEWHFYALGNLGDSKKTDYTRAYDPTDMNEFTIEISDNNTANSQFQSGVFLTDPNDSSTATVETQAMADDPNIDQDPMKYIYPISSVQWNAKDDNDEYINYRHKTLVSDEFDGDHSFEFRYACKGDYRDGDLINDTNGVSEVPNIDPETMTDKPFLTYDDLQYDINKRVWYAFYEWVVTSDETQFKNEATLWFVPSAVEFFYAFTHYYTMMDNRAKNTFWHFAKTGTRRAIPIGRAVPELLHVYEESDGNGGYQPASGTFDNTKQYYTQYAFDLWVYDTDTACGIDNNGELSFPYGKEDTDYRVAGQPASGWAFNGSGSIFWRRLSTTFESDISALMRQEDTNCFSTAQHLINQFDEFQSCFPEEIWRLDIERKYIRTFTGAVMDNSINQNKQNIRFLRAMMQGRKKYQRRQWVRNQAVYFGSKYGLNNVRTAEHTIEFNIYTPSSDGVTELAVPVDQSQLVIKPYQDMYIDVAVGNSTTNLSTQDFKRAKAGERVVVDCRSGGSAQETRVYIFGGEHIAALENLAPMYTYSGSFGQGKHLKTLDLGSDNPNYNNPRFTSISINENMPLLETFNVKNCNKLAQSINLSRSNNLRVFEAEGSLITGISLPAYSSIETLHLPTTVTSIALNSARALSDFYIKNKSTGLIDYSNLISLNVNDSDYSDNINWIDIARQTLDERINMLYLQNLATSSIVNISTLDDFDQKKKQLEVNYGDDGQLIKHIVLSGLLKVTGNWSAEERDYYGGKSTSVWPGLQFDTTEGTQQIKYEVIYWQSGYYLDDGTYVEPVKLKTLYIDRDNPTAPDIYANGTIDLPTRPSSARESYRFGEWDVNDYIPYSGWAYVNTPSVHLESAPQITKRTEFCTWYKAEPRKYPVKWYLYENDDESQRGLIKTSDPINYGSGLNEAMPTVKDIHEGTYNGGYGYSTATVTFDSTDNDIATYSIFNGWRDIPNAIHPLANETSFDIYANWETQTVSLSEMFDVNNLSNLTPEQLLVLSSLNEDQKEALNIFDKLESGATTVEYTLGHDSIKEGTELISAPYRADRMRNIMGDGLETTIQPFNSTNDAFTIAIDYSFNPDFVYNTGATTGVLASCYENNASAGTSGGFILYYNLDSSDPYYGMGPRLGFGDIFKNISNAKSHSISLGTTATAKYRNIIILRHPAGSSELYIYSGMSEDASLPAEVTVRNLSWTANNTSAFLRFGCLVASADLTSNSNYTALRNLVDYGGGTVYWAKYWNEDLGVSECRRLAAWPHEKMTYLLTNLTTTETMNERADNTIVPIPSVHLTSLTASIHGQVQQTDSISSGTVSWDTSVARGIANNRIFLGLPTKLQSILCKNVVHSISMSATGSQSTYEFDSAPILTRDYIYLPSTSNVVNSDLQNQTGYTYRYEEDSEFRPFNYVSTANVEVYDYNSSGQNWVTVTPSEYYQYLNLRFAIKPIKYMNYTTGPNKLRIFRDLNDTIPSTTTISSTIATLRPGDIFTTGTQAYMYVTNLDRQNLGIFVSSDARLADSSGGWTPAYSYWLRSVDYGRTLQRCAFTTINTIGYYQKQGTSGAINANLCYSMAI